MGVRAELNLLELPINNGRPALAGLLQLDGTCAPLAWRPAEPTTASGDALVELPLIETARLRLRACRPGDLPALAEITSLPETFRYSERGPMGTEETWARLLRHAGHWSLFGFGMFVIEEKSTGTLIGETGFADFHRGFGPDFDPFPEASWTLAPRAWGRGYAIEAATAAHDWLSAARPSSATVCLIHHDNAPSVRLAAKLGYRCFGERDYRGYGALIFRRRALVLAPRGDA